MKRERTEKQLILKKVLKVLTTAVLFFVMIGVIMPGKAQAAENVIRKSIKAGKGDNSFKLTKDKNIVIYEIDVPKDDSELVIEFNTSNVSDRLIVTFLYKSEDSTPIYREEIYPDNKNKIDIAYGFGVLKAGKHYFKISGEGTTSTTGTIDIKTTVYKEDLNDEEDNNTYKKAQTLATDGKKDYGYLCDLKTYGLDVDMEDWYVFNTKDQGFVLSGAIEQDTYVTAKMELYDGSGSKPTLLFEYSLSEPQQKFLRSLPAGKYYVRIVWDNVVKQRGFFENQAIYSISVTPYVALKDFDLKSSLSLTTKGSSSKATLEPDIKPSNAVIRTIAWKSSNSKVATVSNGVVKGKKKGTAKITCTITDIAGVTKSKTCKVTVKK